MTVPASFGSTPAKPRRLARAACAFPLMCCKKATSPELPQCGAVTSSDFLESRVIQQQRLISPVDATCGAPNDAPQVRVTVRGNGLRALSKPWGKRTCGCPPRSIMYRRCSIGGRASSCTLYQDTVLLVCGRRWCAKAPWVRTEGKRDARRRSGSQLCHFSDRSSSPIIRSAMN